MGTSFKGLICTYLVAGSLGLAASLAFAQQEEAEPAPPDFSGFKPLEVTVRPRERVTESGIYHDAVVESIHGKFYRFSGLYTDEPPGKPA